MSPGEKAALIAAAGVLVAGTSWTFFAVLILALRIGGEADSRIAVGAVACAAIGGALALLMVDAGDRKDAARKAERLRERTPAARLADESRTQEIEALGAPTRCTIVLAEGTTEAENDAWIDGVLEKRIAGRLVFEGGVWVKDRDGERQIVPGWRSGEPMPPRVRR